MTNRKGKAGYKWREARGLTSAGFPYLSTGRAANARRGQGHVDFHVRGV